ncbi:DUF3060 domain-containing protein [Sphingomonas sp. MMS12-HWE2-04]|uniref:DUF3060 domain-containing protein n=1 Tax=Sphingomonas sp. MMS12-HWE2-04 TaxID=3234199 RepID=UPI00384FFBF9
MPQRPPNSIAVEKAPRSKAQQHSHHHRITSLTVTGASNHITVDFAASSTLRVEGADNEIRWRAPAAAKPRVSVVGAGNRISRQR